MEYVSPQKQKIFDAYLSKEKQEIRIVVFDLHQHTIFSEALNKGVTIMNLGKSSGDNLAYTDSSKLIVMKPTFDCVQIPIQITTVKNALTEVIMFARVHLKVITMKIDVPGISKDMLPFQQMLVTDNTLPNPAPLTVYGDFVGKFELNKCYQLLYVTVSKFSGTKVLKALDHTTVDRLSNDAIALPAWP